MRSPDQILQRLQEGNLRFVADRVDGKLQDSERRLALNKGQAPYAVVVSCADSRVVPEFAFDTGIGELFVIRVAGNIANTSTVASIEYAVDQLRTGVVVVLGHESCGAVTAAVSGVQGGSNLDHLLAHIAPACEAAQGGSLEDVIKKNAELTAQELLKRSEILRAAVLAGQLTITPAYYELASGKVSFA